MMLRLYDNALMKMEMVKDHQDRELKIGTGHAWWYLFVRDTVNAYRRHYPGANLYIDVGNNLRLMDLLLSADIDLFIGHEIAGLSRKAEVKFEPLFVSHDKVYVRQNHPLTYRENCGLEDLVEYPSMEATFTDLRYRGLIEDTQPQKQYISTHRITSYNVCYTKLLRTMAAT